MKYMKMMAVAIGLKIIYNALQKIILKSRGFVLLTKPETAMFMSPYQLVKIAGEETKLPQVRNGADKNKEIFPEKKSVTDEVYVWEYQNLKRSACVSKFGSIIIKHKVLLTDWNHTSFIKDIWKKDLRTVVRAPSVIAPFSQFPDGIWYGGYYDFIFLIATKLSRIIDALPNANFSNIKICYPVFNADYEHEYLRLLDINPENLLDTSQNKVITPHLITGNSARWHPNLSDVISLKRNIEKKFKPGKTSSNRLYISRSCRRHIINEEELIALLTKFDFQIIEDRKRSVEEQIEMYHNASFIVGPHGASFSNVIWCEPGTHLLEIFSPNYAPDFFLYLSTVMKMKYHAYYEEVGNKTNYVDALVEDIYVSIPKFEKCLKEIFNN